MDWTFKYGPDFVAGQVCRQGEQVPSRLRLIGWMWWDVQAIGRFTGRWPARRQLIEDKAIAVITC